MRNVINIRDSKHTFPFVIETHEKTGITSDNTFKILDIRNREDFVTEQNAVFLSDDSSDSLVKCYNYWRKGIFDSVEVDMPSSISKKTFRIVCPDFLPTVYDDLHYCVDITMHIGLKKIYLASKVFGKSDLLSYSKPFDRYGAQYHQYVDIETIDPWDICYSDSFLEFREYVNETAGTNACGSLAEVTITPVETASGNYIPSSKYSCGKNMVMLNEADTDFLSIVISFDAENFLVHSDMIFNEAYGNSMDSEIKQYFSETYGLEITGIVPEIVVMTSEDIYKLVTLPEESGPDKVDFDFDCTDMTFESWNDYHEGLSFAVTYSIMCGQDEVMTVRSSNLPITKDIFRLMVGNQESYKDIDMDITVQNLDVVNKIEKRVVTMSRPEDSKSSIIRPVFYKSYDGESITVFKDVTSNVGISLDSYKSKVSTFYLQIEGVPFQEIGRVSGKVIFKISGAKLPKEVSEGRYYILDDNLEMVTSGKYVYA